MAQLEVQHRAASVVGVAEDMEALRGLHLVALAHRYLVEAGIDGEILVENAPAGIEVFDLAGMRRYSSAASSARIQLPAGIYVVRSGAEVSKVAVK